MTQPVLNLLSAIVRVTDSNGKQIGQGFLISPWNSFFQQLTQAPPAIQNITVGASPFSYTPNSKGQVFIRGGNVTTVSLIRGSTEIDMGTDRTILISIGDTVKVTYTILPTLQFAEF